MKYADYTTFIEPNFSEHLGNIKKVCETFKTWCANNKQIVSENNNKQLITINKINNKRPNKPEYIKMLGRAIENNLQKINNIFNKKQLIIFFNSLVLSIIDYSRQVYGNYAVYLKK